MKFSCSKCKLKIQIPKVEACSQTLIANYLRTYGWQQVHNNWHCKICVPPSLPPSSTVNLLRQASALLDQTQKEVDKKDEEIRQLKETLRAAQEMISTHEYAIQELQDDLKVLQRETRHLRKGINYL
jgi:septal ring factor EnvC (AmiA/AmiB activator)